jgi:hypothetical protein
LRDGGERWQGKGVTRAVANVDGEITAAITGMDASEQEALDWVLIELAGRMFARRLECGGSMPAASASKTRPNRPPRARSKAPREERAREADARPAGARVRWDRLGRAAMLCVLAALVYLYLSVGVHMLSTWRQSHRDSAAVIAMEHEHTLLLRQHATLSSQATLEGEARQLGMMKKGEQPYLVSGLPNN